MTTKKLCLTAMGTALFVVLTLCLQVPVFEKLLSVFRLCGNDGFLLLFWAGKFGDCRYFWRFLVLPFDQRTAGDAGMGSRKCCDCPDSKFYL